MGRKPFTVRTLLKRMDQEGINRSVLLPLSNPENVDQFDCADNKECLAAARRHPDRLIAFCNIDPRALLNTPKADLSKVIGFYKDQGCVGIGEVCANLPITDPVCQNLFFHAGEMKMPVLMHLASRKGSLYGLIDRPGLTGLEKCLQSFPETFFIGHAPTFWNEIDGCVKPGERESYPKGPIRRKGRLWRLLERHPNLYADISAGSGYNALSRDSKRGVELLKRYNRQMLFGTDRFTHRNEPVPPILPFLQRLRSEKQLNKREYENIMFRNFQRIFE